MSTNTDTDTIERPDVKTFTPDLYMVIFHNDDTTPFDFVTMLLRTIFDYNGEDAEDKALEVHTNDKATVGSYTLEIATTYRTKALNTAKIEGHPKFSVSVEKS